jgi:uncharacterized protein YprB with RNaseH-like and TPR domain
MEAYLDIETTGLSQLTSSITVIGIYKQTSQGFELIQLVGNAISRQSVLEALEGVETLYTYNGARFDLTFIEAKLQVALGSLLNHRDLMYDCWQQKLYGGLKAVERCLNIERVTKEVNGLEAINLWWRYVRQGDEAALRTLLAYNREDVVNLKELKERLRVP